MNSTRLDDIKSDCSRIAVQWGNKRIYSRLSGKPDYKELFNHSLRVNYLLGIVNEMYLSGSVVYVGDTALADNVVETVFDKIWHYNLATLVDLADFDNNLDDEGFIDPDDGDGGAVDNSTTTEDHYRSGYVRVSAGIAAGVTFYKNGVPAPLPNATYTVIAWVEGDNGQRQSNLQPESYTAAGFICSDILIDGTLRYQATLDT